MNIASVEYVILEFRVINLTFLCFVVMFLYNAWRYWSKSFDEMRFRDIQYPLWWFTGILVFLVSIIFSGASPTQGVDLHILPKKSLQCPTSWLSKVTCHLL